jgi:filamentous hemagglutinin
VLDTGTFFFVAQDTAKTNFLNTTMAATWGSGFFTTNSGSITLTGAAIGSQTLAPGDSTTIGRTTYNFNQTATALQLAVTGTTYDLFWNGGSSGAWDYTTANWQKDGAGSNIVFVQGDKATLGTASTITVDSGTFGSSVQAASLTVNNSAGTVALSGSAISTTGTFGKSGAGSLTMSNAATFIAGASVGAGSMTTSGSMTVTSGGLNVSGGSLAANGATTITAGGLNVSGGSFTSNAACSSMNMAVRRSPRPASPVVDSPSMTLRVSAAGFKIRITSPNAAIS